MSEFNCVAVTDKAHCSNWLYELNDTLSNLIFVEPEDRVRISSLIDSVEVDIVLVHLSSQDKADTYDTVNGELKFRADLSLIEDLVAINSQLIVIALVEELHQDVLLSIIRSGARDVIRIGTAVHDTQAILNRYQKRSVARETDVEHRRLAEVFSIVNARPSDGNALFAIQLTQALQSSGSTLLLDIGYPRGDVLLLLGLTSRFDLSDVVLNRARLDATLIDTGFARHKSGFNILSVSDEQNYTGAVTGTDLHLVLHALRQHFKHIVINAAGITDADLLKTILTSTTATCVLVEQTIPSCKRNHDLVTLLRQMKIRIPDARLVIDRHSSSICPDADSVSRSFEMALGALLPVADKLRVMCMNTGESILERDSHSAYARSVKKLAAQLLGRPGSVDASLMGAALSRIGKVLTQFRRIRAHVDQQRDV